MKRLLALLLSMAMIASSLVFPGLAYGKQDESAEADVPVYVRQEDSSYERVMVSDTGTDAEEELEAEVTLETQGTRLPAPTGLKWHEWENDSKTYHFNGVAAWQQVEGATGYRWALYRDGKKIQGYYYSEANKEYEYPDRFNTSFLDQFNKSGKYQFKVTALKNYKRKEAIKESKEDSSEVTSEVFNYNLPSQKLGSASNLSWDDSKLGTARWTNPADAAGAFLNLYISKDGKKWADTATFEHVNIWNYSGLYDSNDSLNFIDIITSDGDEVDMNAQYKFTVTPISKDITTIANGPVSDYSPIITLGTIQQEFNEKLDEEIKKVEENPEEAENIKDFLQEQNDTLLNNSVQTNEETYKKVKKLEELYTDSKNIEVEVKVDSEAPVAQKDLTVIGAGFNAKDGASKVTVEVTKPEQIGRLHDSGAKSLQEIGINIYSDNDKVEELDIPVAVTVPVPKNADVKKIKIYNFYSGDRIETMTPTVVKVKKKKMLRFATKNPKDIVIATLVSAQKKYTVTLNANGGTMKIKKKTVKKTTIKLKKGAKYGKLPKPTRKKFKFQGWYTDKKKGKKVTAKTKMNAAKDTTLYARWKKA